MNQHRSTPSFLLTAALALSYPLSAGIFIEVGEAGETLATANVTTGAGPLTTIRGTLIDKAGSEGAPTTKPVTPDGPIGSSPVDDIDLYQIFIPNTAAFSVTVSSNLSVDNDSQLYLFDSAGNQVLFNDDRTLGDAFPQFDLGALTGPAGIYYLGFVLYHTDPVLNPTLTSWNRSPAPFQTGPYELTLTGANPAVDQVVPEPSGMVIAGLLSALLIHHRRRTDDWELPLPPR